jgi:hypothetical protein
MAAIICFNANAQSVTIRYEERANIENQLKNVTDPETRKRVSAHLSKPTNYLLYYDNGVSFYIAEPEADKNEELGLKDNDQAKKIEIGKTMADFIKIKKQMNTSMKQIFWERSFWLQISYRNMHGRLLVKLKLLAHTRLKKLPLK